MIGLSQVHYKIPKPIPRSDDLRRSEGTTMSSETYRTCDLVLPARRGAKRCFNLQRLLLVQIRVTSSRDLDFVSSSTWLFAMLVGFTL